MYTASNENIVISSIDQGYLDYQSNIVLHISPTPEIVRSTLISTITMAPQAFCCDQIRSPTFENEEYRLGLFIYWEKAGNKGPPTKDETPGLNVPFCVQVSQKPKSIRLFVPTGWGEFSEIDRKLLATPWVPHGYVPGEFVAGSRLIIPQDRHIISAGFIARPIRLQCTKGGSNRQLCLRQRLQVSIPKFRIKMAVDTLPLQRQLKNQPTWLESQTLQQIHQQQTIIQKPWLVRTPSIIWRTFLRWRICLRVNMSLT